MKATNTNWRNKSKVSRTYLYVNGHLCRCHGLFGSLFAVIRGYRVPNDPKIAAKSIFPGPWTVLPDGGLRRAFLESSALAEKAEKEKADIRFLALAEAARLKTGATVSAATLKKALEKMEK